MAKSAGCGGRRLPRCVGALALRVAVPRGPGPGWHERGAADVARLDSLRPGRHEHGTAAERAPPDTPEPAADLYPPHQRIIFRDGFAAEQGDPARHAERRSAGERAS
ncbi:hypothetical protein ACTMTI_27040 [Nonomuraea sp. H19]|uniref:hypothetical protein n=1 Tax=Nonomuraea sp. H19 TaxID=3452206 RepID=UPI003F8AE979